MQTGTFIERIKRRCEKWGRQTGSISVDYEDVRALLSAAEALKKHEPHHIALRWLNSGVVILD